MTEKDIKTTKQIHAFKGYATTYNVEILKYFKPESAIKYVLWDLLTQSKSFTVAIAIVLVFKKIECRCKKKVSYFLLTLKSRNNYQWKWHWWCA